MNIIKNHYIPLILLGEEFIIGGLRKIFNSVIGFLDNLLFLKISIDKQENPRCRYAIMEEVKNLRKDDSNVISMSDGYERPESYPDMTSYYVNINPVGLIHISLTDIKIVLRTLSIPLIKKTTMRDFKRVIETIYKKHNNQEKLMMFFTPRNDTWDNPIYRTPRNFDGVSFTRDMNMVMLDVEEFMGQKDEYYRKGIPYKRGYFLYGQESTGKSTIIECIAHKYNMSVYIVNLNSKDMTDTTLINLFSRVPSNSIIALEELDKQMIALEKNCSATISLGGLLSALDGAQRLNNSVITVITANTNEFVSEEYKRILFRKGRVDFVMELKEKF